MIDETEPADVRFQCVFGRPVPPQSPSPRSRQLRPDIRSDDPDFVSLVADFQRQLEVNNSPSAVDDLAVKAGFTQHERDALFAASREQRPMLYNMQQVNKKMHDERRDEQSPSGGGFHLPANTPANRTAIEAMTLAMVYFGVWALLLPSRDEGGDGGDVDMDMDDDAPLSDDCTFLDSHPVDESNIKSDSAVSTVRPVARLLGGAEPTTENGGADKEKTPELFEPIHIWGFGSYAIRTTTTEFLFGRQGVVRFDLRDQSSFVDAVVRLMGATQNVSVSLMYRQGKDYKATAPDSDADTDKDKVSHTIHKMPHDSSKADPYFFDKIRHALLEYRKTNPSWDSPQGINLVPFVHLDDEDVPDRGQCMPETDEMFVLKVVRVGSPATGLPEHLDDTAYISARAVVSPRFRPRHAEREGVRKFMYEPCYRYGANQYGPWMQVVARVLTPGAGLALLEGKPGSLVAHSRLGLVFLESRMISPSAEPFVPFATHGGLGFLQQHFDMLMRALVLHDRQLDIEETEYAGGKIGAEHIIHSQYVHVSFDPLQDRSIGVYLPGLISGTKNNVRPGAGRVKEEDGGKNGEGAASTSFRAGLARCIDHVLEAGLSAEEKEQLVGVDVWPDGAFWNHETRPVPVTGLPCKPESLVTFDDQPDKSNAPSVVAIRPVYPSYLAHIELPKDSHGYTWNFTYDFRAVDASGSPIIPFDRDGPFDKFWDAVRAVMGTVYDEDPDYVEYHRNRIFLRNGRRAAKVREETLNHLRIHQRDGSNRPEFVVSRRTTQDEWLTICSQLVGPEIWVSRDRLADWYEKDTNWAMDPVAHGSRDWGFQPAYHNLVSAKVHEERYARDKAAKKREKEKGKTDVDVALPNKEPRLFWSILPPSGNNPRWSEPLTAPPQQPNPPQSKRSRSRSRTPSQHDPSYKPPSTKTKEESDTSSGEGSGSSGKAAKGGGKKRKAAARRSGAQDDPTYRPEKGEDDEADHDLGSATFVPDDFGEAKKRKRPAPPKVNGPSYKPGEVEEEGEEDEETGLEGGKKNGKKKKLDDPSYHPSRADPADDDDDDQLRQSAVPEYDRDPTDPAGKRVRVIREARTRAAKALQSKKANEKPAVAVTIANAALKSKAKATAAKGKGKQKEKVVKFNSATPSANNTPRRGRSRSGTPALDA